jgi:uncharacterized protein YbjT (DUF2867 family)
MRIAIFGATGRVGSELRKQALAAGHEVTVLARTPGKIPENGGCRPRIVQGDVRDPGAVAQTVHGCDAVLSALGATDRGDPDVRRRGTANIIAAMDAAGIRRLIVMGGFHLDAPGDPDNLGRRLIVPILKLSRHLVEDTTGMWMEIQASDLDWTLVRTPVVRGHGATPVRTGRLRLGPWSHVTRPAVAAFMLRCLTEGAHVSQAPMIAN